ncbi:MAG: hypothetical protein F6K21_30060 [Symploca sp. SIO2D2]|nr:hypothetical protein [Symploca sp. SIO2D2]
MSKAGGAGEAGGAGGEGFCLKNHFDGQLSGFGINSQCSIPHSPFGR